MTVAIQQGDCRDLLRALPDESVHCVVTSPPYWGLRDYCVDGQLGLEPAIGDYVAAMVEVFRDVRRVLRGDGTLWLNLGDSYATQVNGRSAHDTKLKGADDRTFRDKPFSTIGNGVKPKDICGIPWRVAFALQADGWWLRQDIIWSKPNPMPESIGDRCTKAHEYLFLLSKRPRYFFDQAAIAEPVTAGDYVKPNGWHTADNYHEGNVRKYRTAGNKSHKFVTAYEAGGEKHRTSGGLLEASRNRRSVWEITTQPFSEAHFATFPPALIEPCIKAGTSEKGCCAKCGAAWRRKVERSGGSYQDRKARGVGGPYNGKPEEYQTCGQSSVVTLGWSPPCTCDAGVVPCTVLDPFGGAGTTGLVADRLQRNAILIELNPEYVELARRRLTDDAPLFADVREGGRESWSDMWSRPFDFDGLKEPPA